MAEGENKELLRIAHRPSPHFTSTFSNGAIVGGPGPNGMYILLFYADTFDLPYEELEPIPGRPGELQSKKDNVQAAVFREDVARVALTEDAARNLYLALKMRFDPKGS